MDLFSAFQFMFSIVHSPPSPYYFFFFNDPPTTEIYTLPLHDALPISNRHVLGQFEQHWLVWFGIWRLRRESRQRLLQRVLRPHRHGAQARLECRHVHAVFTILPRFAQFREQPQHPPNLFFLPPQYATRPPPRSCSHY